MNEEQVIVLSVMLTLLTLTFIPMLIFCYIKFGSSKEAINGFFEILFNCLKNVVLILGCLVIAAMVTFATFVISHELIIKFFAVKL